MFACAELLSFWSPDFRSPTACCGGLSADTAKAVFRTLQHCGFLTKTVRRAEAKNRAVLGSWRSWVIRLADLASSGCPRCNDEGQGSERLIDFVVSDGEEGEVTIRERCIVADVTQPLLSLGRLLKRGWFPAKDNGSLWLHREATGTSVPMGFKGMSLSMQASIRRVDVEEFRVPEANAVSAPSSPVPEANAVSVQSSPMQRADAVSVQSSPVPKADAVSVQSSPVPKADAVSVQSSPVPKADAVSVQSSPVQRADAVSVQSSPVREADAVSVQSSPHGPVCHVSHIQVRLSVDDLQYGRQVGPTGQRRQMRSSLSSEKPACNQCPDNPRHRKSCCTKRHICRFNCGVGIVWL